MKKITMYETYDGKQFDSIKKANSYLDKEYGNLITKVANKIIMETEGKYKKTIYWIDENLSMFLALNEIKQDIANSLDLEEKE